ncbi:MAG: ribose-5-phosphate isomerase RpiA [Planctomycetota bacterium]
MSDPNAAKRAAGYAAADLVESGTTIGLGTGSTFRFVIERLAARIEQEGLEVRGAPTSVTTASLAEKLGVPLVTLDEVEHLDLAIDGADEVDPKKNLIKGGGGAHLRERIVAACARELVVVVHDGKLVEQLGRDFLLPVEIVPFGWKQAQRLVEATGCTSRLRVVDGAPRVTDNGNWILDCDYGGIADPASLAQQLDSLPGTVDHGLFVGMSGRVVVADDDGNVRILP